MKTFSVAYIGLLLFDAALSLVDSVTSVDLQLSKWTTITLCLGSFLVFPTAAVLGLVVRFRPRWPILVSSGAYCLYFGSLLASAFFGAAHAIAPAEQQVKNLIVAGIQLLLASGCLVALLRASVHPRGCEEAAVAGGAS